MTDTARPPIAEGVPNRLYGRRRSHPLRPRPGPRGGRATIDTLAARLLNPPVEVAMVESVNGCDLTCDSVLLLVLADIGAGRYPAALLSPPCGAFSVARCGDGGPVQLRDADGPGRYGRA